MAGIAVVGATGAVGKTLLSILEQRRFPHDGIRLFASARSEGREIPFLGRTHRCRRLEPGCFDGIGLVFFDASDAVSREWVPLAAESGAWVVDNSAAFRMEAGVPLVVPEVNGEKLRESIGRARAGKARDRIIAGPNCSTAQMVVALRPIQSRWGLKRVVVSTYQSTSGAGAAAMSELASQTAEALQGGARSEPRAFAHRIAFNCIPQIGSFRPDGYTGEEAKMIEESRKILGLPSLRITATTVRVPTFACHGESVNVECERPLDPDEVRGALRAFPGVKVIDEPGLAAYPMGASEEAPASGVEAGAGRDAVYVGRIRRDESVDHGVNLWIVSDNLRKGAALNAVQIGEALLEGLR